MSKAKAVLGYKAKLALVRQCFESQGWDFPFASMKCWLAARGCIVKSKGYLLCLRALVRQRYKPDWRRATGASSFGVVFANGKKKRTGQKTGLQWVRECFEALGWQCTVYDMGEWLALRGISMSTKALHAARSNARERYQPQHEDTTAKGAKR